MAPVYYPLAVSLPISRYSQNPSGAIARNETAFTDIGAEFADFNFTAVAQREYIFLVQTEFFYNPMGGGGGVTDFRLSVNGTPDASPPVSWSPVINQSGIHFSFDMVTSLVLSVGSKTIRLQCKTYAGNTVNWVTSNYLAITVF